MIVFCQKMLICSERQQNSLITAQQTQMSASRWPLCLIRSKIIVIFEFVNTDLQLPQCENLLLSDLQTVSLSPPAGMSWVKMAWRSLTNYRRQRQEPSSLSSYHHTSTLYTSTKVYSAAFFIFIACNCTKGNRKAAFDIHLITSVARQTSPLRSERLID